MPGELTEKSADINSRINSIHGSLNTNHIRGKLEAELQGKSEDVSAAQKI